MNNLDKPHKLDLHSASSAQINLDALYQIAPQCFAETRDPKTGAAVRTIDFNALRQMLGDQAIDAPAYEAYQFTWVGKHDARAEAARPTDKTLRPITADSLCWDTTRNLYIEGDNLEVLKLLQKSYQGKVKMIYIDPPYNTGNDFVYRDNFAADKNEYLEAAGATDSLGNRYIKNTDTNGRYHSDWCSMIYSRLMVARTLLSDDGVIFISIDDNEVHNLRKICDELFGEGNFVAQINWKRSGGRQDSKYYAVIHEYVLCYAKDLSNFEAGEEIKTGEVYPKYDEDKKRYYKSQLLRKWGSNSLRENRPNLYYPIKDPDGQDLYPIIYQENKESDLGFLEIQGRWRWSASNLENAMREGRIEFQKNKWGKWIAYEKIFAPLEGENNTKKYSTWIDDTNNGTDSIKKLFSTIVFDYSKSADMIIRFLKMANLKENDLILDFFSGSATTAHAVMQLNAEDGGNRRYIMVQLPEETPEGSEARKAGYTDIPSIAKERIRRAGAKIKTELQEQIEKAQKELSATQAQLKAEQGKMLNDEVLKSLTEKLAQQQSELQSLQERYNNLDTGFRVLRLDSSNFQDVYLSPKDYEQGTLEFYEDNIKRERDDLDLLFGCMLSWGVQLSLPMQSEVVEGKTIYTVNEGDLVACFAHKVSLAVIEAMAEKQPLRVIFRDSCFESDADKINIYETFKQKMDWSDQEVFKNIRVI